MRPTWKPKGRVGELPDGLSGRDLAWQIAKDDRHEDGEVPPGVTRRFVRPVDRYLPTVTPWHRSAECAKPEHADIDFIKPGGAPQREQILDRTCRRCSVTAECLAEAIELERHNPTSIVGIRGGLTAQERKALIWQLPEEGVVYFGQRDDLIKIGTSKHLSTRSQVLGIDVLATEPGGYRREHELHLKFDHLRLTERGEWFRAGDDLLDYIESLRQAVAA